MNKTIANISINTIRDAELEAVLKQFLSTIGAYSELFGINDIEIERLHLELQFFSWVLDTEQKVRSYLNDLKHFKKLSRTIPKYEIMESLQNLTVPGTEQFYRQPQGGLNLLLGKMIQKIKRSRHYTREIGMELGIAYIGVLVPDDVSSNTMMYAGLGVSAMHTGESPVNY